MEEDIKFLIRDLKAMGYNQHFINQLENLLKSYKKIKEKIEDLNDYKSEFCQRVINHKEHTLTEFVQNILQELMEINYD